MLGMISPALLARGGAGTSVPCPEVAAGFPEWAIPFTCLALVLYLAQIGWWLARVNSEPQQFQNRIAAAIGLVPFLVPFLLYVVDPLVNMGDRDG